MSNHSKFPKGAGIYKFTCLNNGKIYIGKSVGLRTRLGGHKTTSKKLKGKFHFENALIKHGWDSFSIEILETFEDFDKSKLEDRTMILDRETYYIGLFDSDHKDKGYNICKYSTDRTGHKCSEEHKEKVRQSKLGTKHSEESKEKIRVSKLGTTHSEETKEKIRGYKHSDEHKEHMKRINLGKKLSPETKEKMRQAKLKNPMSQEAKEHLRRIKTGLKHSEETKEKMKQSRAKRSTLNQ